MDKTMMRKQVPMSTNVAFEQFFEFEVHFTEFIQSVVIFDRVVEAHFFIFDPETTNITYQYNYLSDYKYENEDVMQVINASKMEFEEDNIEYRYLLDVDELSVVVINFFNDYDGYKQLVGSCIIKASDQVDIPSIRDRFNSKHFKHLCLHVQSIILNYEKLFYIIDVFTELMMSKDKFMPYHMSNVANWSIRLSSNLSLNDNERTILYLSALLHDIGKLFVSDSIINKPAKLSDFEYEEVKKHPRKGAEIVSSLFYGMSGLDDIQTVIKHHHEHYDGTGYPDGLATDQIPYLSRILKVADTVDAMLSRRAYKDASTFGNIISELALYSGRHFDPIIANEMIEIIDGLMDYESSDTIANTSFIAQASISFFYGDYHRHYTYKGNLIIRGQKGHFLAHGKIGIEKFDRAKVIRPSISFFSFNDFLEYRIDVMSLLENKFFIKNFIFMPTDKLFSMVWPSKVRTMTREHGILDDVEVIKLGANSIVLRLNNDRPIANEFAYFDAVNLKFELDELSINIVVDVRTLKVYEVGSDKVFVLMFKDLSSREKDILLKLLFRKQTKLKRLKKDAVESFNALRRDGR